MIRVTGLQKTYGTMTVLSDVTFTLGSGQRAALVGYNGTGKSTILKILAGLVPADAGEIDFGPHARIGYLPQDTSLAGDESILAYLRRVTGIERLETEMAEAGERLDQPDAKHRYDAALTQYEQMDGYSFEYHAEAMLAGFGLEKIGLDRSVANLSSGQKSKISLIAILLQENDVLLLDEPTNNLDLPALIWLEDFIRKSSATVLIVSHDRRFVDRIANKIIELDWHTRTTNVMNGTYTDYLTEMQRRRERQLADYVAQQETIDRLSDRAEDLKRRAARGANYSGTDNDKFRRGFMRDKAAGSAKVAKGLEKRIEQMDLVERPYEREPLEISVTKGLGEGDRDITLTDVVAGYPGAFVVGPLSLSIPFGSRLGILGMNGVGKSTILRVITGNANAISGRVQIGRGVRLGDMMQEHDSLPRDVAPVAFLKERAGLEATYAFGLLAQFGIPAAQAREPIHALSPGGRARILIALFSTLGKNVLVLDEPTNHLDLEAMDALEEALGSFKGTLLVVSHDRHFISQTRLNEMYELVDGRLEQITDFAEYLKRAETRARRLLRKL